MYITFQQHLSDSDAQMDFASPSLFYFIFFFIDGVYNHTHLIKHLLIHKDIITLL